MAVIEGIPGTLQPVCRAVVRLVPGCVEGRQHGHILPGVETDGVGKTTIATCIIISRDISGFILI